MSRVVVTAKHRFFSAYNLALLATEGTRWSVYLVTGSVALAGIVGWLLSYLITLPPFPDKTPIT